MPSSIVNSIINVAPLGSPWTTIDPFLICAYHVDNYPRGNADLGPASSPPDALTGHDDIEGKDGWRMYYGETVPGFPAHPHRGFETITIMRKGVVDHSDSLGASARFGAGDVQWLTAGRGIVHAEMFPLLETDAPNPLEAIQIWLNLPARNKMVDPLFTMFWAQDIPLHVARGGAGLTEVLCIVSPLSETDLFAPPAPPQNSWASDPTADVAIWSIKMEPGAMWTLPAAAGAETRRQLFFFAGSTITLDGQMVTQQSAIEVRSASPIEIVNGSQPCEILMLQARPIGEPVAQHGPFVMNTAEEIAQAYADYNRTGFGRWDWPSKGPVHGHDKRRFESR